MALTVIYNSYTLPNVYGNYKFSSNYEAAIFSCNFIVKSDSAANLITARNIAENKLREPLENLTIQFAGNTHKSFSHSSNTGMNARVEFSSTDVVSTEISQSFTFKFVCQLPADKSSFDFRQSSSTTVNTGPAGERTVNVSLTYTAGDSNSATENFDDFAEAFAENILDGLGGSGIYDLVSINKNNDDQDKVCTGTLVYKEILDDQSEINFNEENIVDLRANYSVSRRQPIGISRTGGYVALPMTFVNASFSCTVKKTVTVANSEILYRNTIRPWITKHSKDVVGLESVTNAGLNYITQSDDVSFDPTSSTISGRIVFFAPLASQILELSESIQRSTSLGRGFDKLWNRIENSYLVYEIGEMNTVIRTITVKQLDIVPAAPLPLDDNSLFLVDKSESETVMEDGKNSADDFAGEITSSQIFTKTFTEIYRKVDVENSVFINAITPEG